MLHETPSPFDEIPVYPRQKDSFPYYVAVSDPQQPVPETLVKGFNVDDPFPLINIVLLGSDVVTDFDLGIPYNEAFQRGRWDKRVDYANEPDPDRARVMKNKRNRDVPPAIDTYSSADQERIRAKMREVVDAVQHQS